MWPVQLGPGLSSQTHLHTLPRLLLPPPSVYVCVTNHAHTYFSESFESVVVIMPFYFSVCWCVFPSNKTFSYYCA